MPPVRIALGKIYMLPCSLCQEQLLPTWRYRCPKVERSTFPPLESLGLISVTIDCPKFTRSHQPRRGWNGKERMRTASFVSNHSNEV